MRSLMSCNPCESERCDQFQSGDLVESVIADFSCLQSNESTGGNKRVLRLTPGHFGLDNCLDARVAGDGFFAPEQEEMHHHESTETPEGDSRPGARATYVLGHTMGNIGVDVLGDLNKGNEFATRKSEKSESLWRVGERMDADEMMEKLWWCCWCCFAGCGCRHVYAPCSFNTNCCCFNYRCQSTSWQDIEGNVCGLLHQCCCCLWMCRGPPKTGTHRCMCCSRDCCGIVGGRGQERESKQKLHHEERKLAVIDRSLSDLFIPCWCCGCMGLACRGDCAWETYLKCPFCEYFFTIGLPDCDAGLFTYLLNCGYLYSACHCPPKQAHNPLVACCGCHAKKEDGFGPSNV